MLMTQGSASERGLGSSQQVVWNLANPVAVPVCFSLHAQIRQPANILKAALWRTDHDV